MANTLNWGPRGQGEYGRTTSLETGISYSGEYGIFDQSLTGGDAPAHTRLPDGVWRNVGNPGIRAWEEGWWQMPVTVGNLVGKIIGAGPGEVVMHQNVSVCQSLVHSCFNWTGKRNKLVTESLNVPSNLYLFEGLERIGAQVVTVNSADGLTAPLDAMLAAIDEETQLVSVSHVLFRRLQFRYP